MPKRGHFLHYLYTGGIGFMASALGLVFFALYKHDFLRLKDASESLFVYFLLWLLLALMSFLLSRISINIRLQALLLFILYTYLYFGDMAEQDLLYAISSLFAYDVFERILVDRLGTSYRYTIDFVCFVTLPPLSLLGYYGIAKKLLQRQYH